MIFAALFGFSLLVAWVITSRLSQTAEASIPEGEGIIVARGLIGTFLPEGEDQLIFTVAESRGVDARLLAAIRKAENGGPGREFGVLSVPAKDYYAQASIAANSIANNVERYESGTGQSARSDGRLTRDFIAFMGARWAPVGAQNDPTGLNQNWVDNVTTWYERIDYATA